MANAQSDESTYQARLRLMPGVIIVALQWFLRFFLPVFVPEATTTGFLGGLLGWLAIVVWWGFFSRAPRLERWGAVALMVVALAATPLILHASIAKAMGGLIFVMYATPILSLAFVVWAVASRRLAEGPRRATLVAMVLLACGGWALLRSDGMTGGGGAQFAWRWTKTSEERLLAQAGYDSRVTGPLPESVDLSDVDWPGFRGPDRNSILPGVRIETDWVTSPPVELWRRPIGPGWSSFAVAGNLIYTQEQRGEEEVVTCYDGRTGEPIWRHTDGTRFWEAIGGPGPRATPTLSKGRLYTFGATGTLNVFNASDGTIVWSRNVASDTGVELPTWGFSSSPLVVDDLVIVAAAGTLAAYDLATGSPRWTGSESGDGYSSPHRMTIDGVSQILLMSGSGVSSVAAADGLLLWKHAWKGEAIVQPALTSEGDLLIGSSSGTARLSILQGFDGWTVEEHWSANGLKPYFNDFVIHKGHAYGFDGRFLACIDVESGERQWKGGRYGSGQLLLLPDQDVLLVVSEKGQLALAKASPDGFRELARVPAIEGKSWNHPVLVGDLLLVRNGEEMAAFRLMLESS